MIASCRTRDSSSVQTSETLLCMVREDIPELGEAGVTGYWKANVVHPS